MSPTDEANERELLARRRRLSLKIQEQQWMIGQLNAMPVRPEVRVTRLEKDAFEAAWDETERGLQRAVSGKGMVAEEIAGYERVIEANRVLIDFLTRATVFPRAVDDHAARHRVPLGRARLARPCGRARQFSPRSTRRTTRSSSASDSPPGEPEPPAAAVSLAVFNGRDLRRLQELAVDTLPSASYWAAWARLADEIQWRLKYKPGASG